MNDWIHCTLGKIAEIKHGFAFKGEFFSDVATKYLLLTPGNVAIGGGFQEKPKFYDGPIPTNYVLSQGDLIVTMTDLSKQGDTLGYSAIIPTNDKYLHNQRIGLVTIKGKDALKEFVYWLMRTYEYQRYIVNHASGSTVKHTSPKTILAYEFELPPIGIQRSIIETLQSIDDKIANNTKINHHLAARSATDSSPDIRRGKSESLIDMSFLFSLLLLFKVCSMAHTLSNQANCTSIGGCTTLMLLR